ncbi:DUF11 domain-containing protein [Lachnospiraceae bacterium]|nr:DUF11 domain-containing protein [Lachnospiraceae bacterium]
MRRAIRSLFIAVYTIIIVDVTFSSMVVFAYGNNGDKIRDEYTNEDINSGKLGNTITFNSISDGAIGHEFNFTGARVDDGNDLGPDNKWLDDIVAEDGQTYVVRLYAHNNSNLSGDINHQTWRQDGKGVAENTKVAFSLDQGSADKLSIHGIVSSSNATPTEYYDDVRFTSKDGRKFHFEYVYGSALLENKGIASKNNPNKPEGYVGRSGYPLSDDIVKAKSGGTLIGFDALDGKVPGCYDFDNYVSIKVKTVYDPSSFTLNKTVRIAGTTGYNWRDNLDAKIGDEVEYQIFYTNTSEQNQYNVMIRDSLPANLEYVEGSTRLWNASMDGYTNDDDTITTTGVNIGNYGPGANAYVRFRAKIVDENLTDGSNTLVNWAKGTVNYGTGSEMVLQDFANVTIQKLGWKNKVCIIIYFILGLVCLVLSVYLFNKSRKQKNKGQS